MRENHWHKAGANELSPREADWLLEPGSLTARVRARCETAFHLTVVRETGASPEEVPEDWPYPALPRLREVTLNCGDTPLVFARTLMPDPATSGNEWLLSLGDRPLGDVLFQSGGTRDGDFEIALLTPESDLFQCAARQRADLSVNLMRNADACIWARRSWVNLEKSRILICECFLPGLI